MSTQYQIAIRTAAMVKAVKAGMPLGEIARMWGVSSDTVSKTLREELGENPQKLLQRVRISKAKMMARLGISQRQIAAVLHTSQYTANKAVHADDSHITENYGVRLCLVRPITSVDNECIPSGIYEVYPMGENVLLCRDKKTWRATFAEVAQSCKAVPQFNSESREDEI